MVAYEKSAWTWTTSYDLAFAHSQRVMGHENFHDPGTERAK
jgi:hypothetical protein